MRVSIIAMLATIITLTATLQLSAEDFQVPIDDSFGGGSITSDSESAILYEYHMGLVQHEGRVALCGVGYLHEIRVRSLIRNMLRGASIHANGQLIKQDFSFFSRARSQRSLNETLANCEYLDTDLPSGSLQFEVNMAGGRFRL